ncbi:hypothetical protein CRUP_028315 [Coryphaenoides rupestris]|nr:hypothetical protein CRUP_028315 [Coryphaenoides rupestris]
MRGLGVEVAHNVILSGVRSVTVQDQGPVLLNPGVQVTADTGPLTRDMLLRYQVVVLTDSPLEEQKRLGNHCHSHGIRFIVVDTKGLCGQLFCDFGEEFTVLDRNGEAPVTALIQNITKGDPGLVTCVEDKNHVFVQDCKVSFSEVCGMTELNAMGPQEIKVTDWKSFTIGDTSGFSEYKWGGMVTEVKEPSTLKFKPLEEALLDHGLVVMTDYGKDQRHQTLHLAFQGLHAFLQKEQRLPRPASQSDAAVLLDLVRELNAAGPRLQHLDEDVVRLLARTARGHLAPLNAFMGGVAAQEVLKACSGKFTPLQQWLYFDALECLQQDFEEQLTESNFSSNGSRYDGQIAVFGSAFQERLGKLKYFLVGAGAIGCELLKNFALMGLGAGEGGHITRHKSTVAAEAVLEINPGMNITAHQNRLDVGSESVYDRRFFRVLDGVTPMLEGGTQGSKGHTLVVVPHLTESYGPQGASADDAIPLCTLKNFPHRIEHTLQWARDHFEGLFKQVPENVNLFLRDAGFVERTLGRSEAEALEVLEGVSGSLRARGAGGRRPARWEDCVHWARHQWEDMYNSQIQQLLHHFPADQVTGSGLPFWSGTKRCPHPLTFDPHKDAHMQYIVSAANLYGHIYGIAGTRDIAAIRETLKDIVMPPFVPNMEADEAEDVEAGISDAAMQMLPVDFEKDDDSNFHMDYIVAASNLRAEIYGIPPADRLQSKRIAGRIIPAIATTTAAVAGLMCLELYKLVQGHGEISSYRSAFMNLAVDHFVMAWPAAPPRFTEKHSLQVTSLFYGSAMVYNASNVSHEDRLQLSVSDVVRRVTRSEIPQHTQILELFASFEEDEDCERVPPIRYLLQ